MGELDKNYISNITQQIEISCHTFLFYRIISENAMTVSNNNFNQFILTTEVQ